MSTSLQVATRRQSVEVYFGPGESTSGAVFLHGAVAAHAGEETVLDVLNEPHPFFPLRVETPQPRTLLVAKAQVRYLRVPRRGSMMPPPIGAAVLLEVQCDDGELLQGRAAIELPPGRGRTLDFVNSVVGGFFLLVERDHDLLVNRSHVRHVCDVTDQPVHD